MNISMNTNTVSVVIMKNMNIIMTMTTASVGTTSMKGMATITMNTSTEAALVAAGMSTVIPTAMNMANMEKKANLP
jgi:hypothetical protein